ncbi:transient receptor potential cation channel subfamily M member-like 2 [Saccostrea cucullata]|uniref:transient receptor potential cation channel subfamily M member-like 2 n=1 Tax=Saccostrea cuccullata TaxID=36930 RepID=UPI002ED38B5D
MRKKLIQYLTDKWNVLDWLCIVLYLCGMIVKLGETDDYLNASKVLLVATYILFCVRILHMFCVSELLGPKLVMIQKMFLDTSAFMTIMFVILMCFDVSYYSILYAEKSDFTFDELERIARNGYWMLFGELNLDRDKLREPECTFNHSIYTSGNMERCPSALGIFLAPYLKAVYVLITVILLLNLLIAMYSNTFSKVHTKSTLYWSQLQTNFLDEFGVKSIFPVHMCLLSLVVCSVYALAWIKKLLVHNGMLKCFKSPCVGTGQKSGNKKEEHPLFVQVFLYNSRYDLKMSGTIENENRAALMTKGEMEILYTEDFKKSILDLEMSSYDSDENLRYKKFSKRTGRDDTDD